ncbi:GntR family transcriptional regulator [Actinomadura roseirufa]|uniref:GntR family transcriptional regulator n=1 Tax=Actinomadura roseirufa TaxID=2094049 RepID=UPI0013F1527B|nr:GntR family transcriptional regulator [Actinomadura roseirufa]
MKINPLPPPAPTLEEEVYRRLRGLIVAGDLVPGELYSMNELSTQLKVSRTPVAQAVTRLVDQGMVRVEHRRGMRILETSTHDLMEIYELRLLLEPRAVYRATTLMRETDHRRMRDALKALQAVPAALPNPRELLRRDAAFHRVILRASGNLRLADYVDGLRDLQMVRGASTADRVRPLAEVIADHERICRRVVAGDAAGAAREMHGHIALTCSLLVEREIGAVPGLPGPPWPDAAGTRPG